MYSGGKGLPPNQDKKFARRIQKFVTMDGAYQRFKSRHLAAGILPYIQHYALQVILADCRLNLADEAAHRFARCCLILHPVILDVQRSRISEICQPEILTLIREIERFWLR